MFLYRFLVDALEYLNDHVKVEGLFRKSGSVGRQKVLRVSENFPNDTKLKMNVYLYYAMTITRLDYMSVLPSERHAILY